MLLRVMGVSMPRRRDSRRLALWAAFIFLACFDAASAEKRVALVIGNSSYQSIGLLANPANDAKLIAATLQALGFTLVGGGAQIDLTKAAFDRAVQSFGAQLQGADVGLFYYAGHGLQIRGANYLVPVDSNPTREADADFQMLDTDLVLRQMEGAATKLSLIILDACRNNPFGTRGLRTGTGGLAHMRAPEGTLIAFATQPGNVARDGLDGNSPYTKALAQSMRHKGWDLFRTFNEVGLQVMKATAGAQQPWTSSSPIAGTFFFAGPPASQPSDVGNGEAVWELLKRTTDVAALHAFVRQFPTSPRKQEAQGRIVELQRNQMITRVASLSSSPRISIDAPGLKGSIALKGARLDDLTVVRAPEYPTVLSPGASPPALVVELGWLAARDAGAKVPDSNTIWHAEAWDPLKPDRPLTLIFENGEGLQFRRTVSVDSSFLLSIEDQVTNRRREAVELVPYALLARRAPQAEMMAIGQKETLAGRAGSQVYQRVTYAALSERDTLEFSGTGAWLGVVSKDWAAILLPGSKVKAQARFTSHALGEVTSSQADFRGSSRSVAPGGVATSSVRLFVGPRDNALLSDYEKRLQLNEFAKLLQ